MLNNPLLASWLEAIESALRASFPAKDPDLHPLEEAMEYSLLAGGKRLRPILTLTVLHSLGHEVSEAVPLSLASEMLHTYSLIHDDLPAMDDDVLRRGKPTSHVVYGQAIAILAGDALQAEAFARLASAPFPGLTAERRMVLLGEFATAVGRLGMVGGQVMDMHQTGRTISQQLLRRLHGRKTGALIRFAVRLGGHLALAGEGVMAALDHYGDRLGLLFQVVDDLLDIEADSATLGKTAGKDLHQQKATFPQLMGLTAAKDEADRLVRSAIEALTSLPHDCKLLVEMAHYVRGRGH